MSNSLSEDDARPVRAPFVIVNRGEDSVDKDERVLFSDFSPTVLPADTPTDEVVEPEEVEEDPKDSVTDGAPLTPASPEATEPTSSETTVQTPADSGSSSSESDGTPASSSPKNGG